MSARGRGDPSQRRPFPNSNIRYSYISLGSQRLGDSSLDLGSRVGGRKEMMRPPGSSPGRHGAAAAALLLLLLLQLAAVRAQRTTTDPVEGELARSFLELNCLGRVHGSVPWFPFQLISSVRFFAISEAFVAGIMSVCSSISVFALFLFLLLFRILRF